MFRFLHTSDWHLGRALYGQSLIEDQSFILTQMLDLIDQRRPHALIIAGDVFDRALPPESAVKLFDWFLSEVALKRKVPVVLIPGNHDSRERVGFASSLLRNQNVTIFGDLEDAFHPVQLRGNDDQTYSVYGIPFVEPIEIGQLLGQMDVRTPDQATRLLCARLLAAKENADPAILICHAFVTGGEVSESEKEIYIGGSSQVDASAFDGFVYTALGHLHKPQRAGRDHVRYSGSLLHYSKSEIGHSKSVTEVHLGLKDNKTEIVEMLFHELKPKRALRYVEGDLTQLMESGRSEPNAQTDYIIAGFTDGGAVLDAFAKLRTVYPQLLHISRAGGFVPNTLPAVTREREEMSDFELFTEFFRDSTGHELSEPERVALIEMLKSVGPT